jgi:hypothetical protein
MSCPYPGLSADIAAAIVALVPGAVAEADMQVAEAQQGIAVHLDLDDRGHIASHSMFVAVVLVIPAVAGVVAVLRFPMSCSIYRMR